MLIKAATKVVIHVVPVNLGSKFTGKSICYINEGTGEYQYSMPPVDVELQKSLFKEPSNDQVTRRGFSTLLAQGASDRAGTVVRKEPTDPTH